MARSWLTSGALAAVACVAAAAACSSYPTLDEPEFGVQAPPRPTPTTSATTTSETPPPPPPPADAGADATDAQPDANRTLRTFVTSQTRPGNLGGVAGADALCAQLATAANLTGTFRAWLSVAGTPAADRITSNGPWQLVTGEVVATTKAQLTSGQLQRALNKDEKGATPPAVEDRVWTGTNGQGQAAGADCNGWMGGGAGRVGEAEHANQQWTTLTDEACTEVNRVYCFEL